MRSSKVLSRSLTASGATANVLRFKSAAATTAAPVRAFTYSRPANNALFRQASPSTFSFNGLEAAATKRSFSQALFKKTSTGVVVGKNKTQGMFRNSLRRMNAAAESAKGGIMAFPKEHPFATNIIIATLKTSACDILVQQYIEKKKNIDWVRVSVFTAFGCLYLGFFQWAIYVTLFGKLFPGMAKFANMPFKDKIKDTRGILNLCGQTAFDNFIHYTFIYFPVFYTFKEAIQGTGYEKSVETVVGKSMGKYKENFWEDNMKIWGLWIPGDMIIYAVPMWMRLPLNHGLSFIWTCYLSFLRGDDDTAAAEPEDNKDQEADTEGAAKVTENKDA